MQRFATKRLAQNADVLAPDGSEVRILCRTGRGSMAHFTLPSGEISKAVAHRTIEEIWFIASGSGRFWRKQDTTEETLEVSAGMSLTIPTGTHFQFRNDGQEPLTAVGVTMPPWPGEDEAYFVDGPW